MVFIGDKCVSVGLSAQQRSRFKTPRSHFNVSALSPNPNCDSYRRMKHGKQFPEQIVLRVSSDLHDKMERIAAEEARTPR